MDKLYMLSCLDSDQMAAYRQQELNILREAAALDSSATEAVQARFYVTQAGQKVFWRDAVQASCADRLSIAPDWIHHACMHSSR
jgi:hypothetical protein